MTEIHSELYFHELLHVSFWVLTSILLLLVLMMQVLKFCKEWGRFSTEERNRNVKAVLKNLKPLTLFFITEAEFEYGDGKGLIKRSYVLNHLYHLIPDKFKQYVTENDLIDILEKELESAKVLWTQDQDLDISNINENNT